MKMKDFSFFTPTECIFECGGIKKLPDIVLKYSDRAMLVTENINGPLGDKIRIILEMLKSKGISVVHFDGVVPNPTTDVVTMGANIAKESDVQVMIGFGGGSSMDTAKGIAVEATHEGSAWDYNCHTDGPDERTLPIILVPTTAGTGSQATQCAVITKSSDKDKGAIWHKNIFPKVSIIDPEMTLSMPESVTAQTGFDAFCHNFEAYISVNASPITEALSLLGIELIISNLPIVLENPNDINARFNMCIADTLGGYTNSNANMTLPHGLGMQIGGHCPQITHGQSLAIIYPQCTRFTHKHSINKFAKVARMFNDDFNNLEDEAAAEKLCDEIDNFLKNIGLWLDFESFGVAKQDIREIADCGQVLGDYKNDPRIASIEEMYELLMACYKKQSIFCL